MNCGLVIMGDPFPNKTAPDVAAESR
jgi:hypothetical protein